MEQNRFDGLEEIETENNYIPEKKEKKEYEKLLGFERARLDYEKATSLIKFGCFKQEEKPTVDFSRLEKVDYEKKYKFNFNCSIGCYVFVADNVNGGRSATGY